mmetsp:Transcript_11174/g.37034  ORF Transcript_11174/g.37034 Transcript_11174/m.37034 type:complete len:210 (+) Transcript_11174:198-827(+)
MWGTRGGGRPWIRRRPADGISDWGVATGEAPHERETCRMADMEMGPTARHRLPRDGGAECCSSCAAAAANGVKGSRPTVISSCEIRSARPSNESESSRSSCRSPADRPPTPSRFVSMPPSPPVATGAQRCTTGAAGAEYLPEGPGWYGAGAGGPVGRIGTGDPIHDGEETMSSDSGRKPATALPSVVSGVQRRHESRQAIGQALGTPAR